MVTTLCAAAGVCSGPALAALPAHDLREAVLRDHRRFVNARQHADWHAMLELVETLALSPPAAGRLLRAYFDLVSARSGSGQALVAEDVEAIEFYRTGSIDVAFLRVLIQRHHPMFDDVRSVRRTVYAFSTDTGHHWRFNVLDCFDVASLRRLAPGYVDTPKFELTTFVQSKSP